MLSNLKPKRGPGRPRVEAHRGRTIWVTDAGWTWLLSQATVKGHASVGKWADALGLAPMVEPSPSKKREYGHEVTVEPDENGSYAWSIYGIAERQGFQTVEEMGKACGVSPRTVEGWRHGKRPSGPALAILKRLASDKPAEMGPRDSMGAALRVSANAPAPTPNARPGGSIFDPLSQLEEMCAQPEPAELEVQSQP